ncbi:hypothetical protein [Aquabacterium humicola]|uniref:hypothetical protein n=1 Tax=Aquabacterium humicola TaxID=3237377 RepID=UPI002543E8C5|nr:hypothetical protein [Rubrivivax pictus]
MRIRDQVITPILGNLPLFTLSWALVAVLAIVTSDPKCHYLSLGSSELMIQVALGLPFKSLIVWLTAFYLVVGILYSLTGKHGRMVEIQDKFLRPIVVPVLFQLAGLVGGLQAESSSLLRGMVSSAAIGILALVMYNVAQFFEQKNAQLNEA